MSRYLMALDAGIGGGRCVVFDTQDFDSLLSLHAAL